MGGNCQFWIPLPDSNDQETAAVPNVPMSANGMVRDLVGAVEVRHIRLERCTQASY